MEWKNINPKINKLIVNNDDIEELVEEIIELLEDEGVDPDDLERAETVLYAKMDESTTYKSFIRNMRPKLKKTLDVIHFEWNRDDEEDDPDLNLSDEQIEGGIY